MKKFSLIKSWCHRPPDARVLFIKNFCYGKLWESKQGSAIIHIFIPVQRTKFLLLIFAFIITEKLLTKRKLFSGNLKAFEELYFENRKILGTKSYKAIEPNYFNKVFWETLVKGSAIFAIEIEKLLKSFSMKV